MINKSTLLGRLARDPEIREFSNGGKVCKLRLITSRSYPDPTTGEFQERTEGHNIAIYVDKIADRIYEKCRKGDIVFVEGPMETRRWTDQNDITHYMTEVAIRPRLGGIRRLPTGRPSSPAESSQAQEQVSSPEQEKDLTTPDTIPENLEDPFDDDFMSNGFGEFGSDLGSFADDDFPL
jgi:single-strand DNA-binding protein